MKPSSYLKNLQLSTNWRAQFNPLRGLTIAQLVAMLEAGERGNYARLQWLYRFVEKRNPTLRAVLQRRMAALTRLGAVQNPIIPIRFGSIPNSPARVRTSRTARCASINCEG